MALQILHEHEVNRDIGDLDRAWMGKSTFAFVPDKGGVPDAWIAGILDCLPDLYREGHFALLTSGSTGRPKLVFGRRERTDSLAHALHEAQDSEPVSESIVTLPLTYCYAFVNQWLWARVHDRRLVLTRGLSHPGELKGSLLAADDAMLCLVGAQVPMLEQYLGGTPFPGVIRVHFAGGRFPEQKLAEVQALFPNGTIFNNYGCAEAMPRLTLRRADAAQSAGHIGWPLPGITLKTATSGELLFRSPYGAVAQADETGFSIIDKEMWVPTGDLGEQAEDGHVELHGREGDVFKRYGEKISLPLLLHSVAIQWPGQVGVYREVDGAGEEGYVLILAPHPSKAQVMSILKALRADHPRPHWPLRVESLETLPLLPNGKVDLGKLALQSDTQERWRQRI